MLAHLLLIIPSSEVISLISKFLHLFKDSIRQITTFIGLSQVFRGTFSNFCTLNTSLIISIMILDIVAYRSPLFRLKMTKAIVYSLVFIIPLLFSLISRLIQMLKYNKLAKQGINKECAIHSCWVADEMGSILLIIILTYLLFISIMCSVIIFYLCRQKQKKVRVSLYMTDQTYYRKKRTVSVLLIFVYRALLLMISSVIIWATIYSGRFIHYYLLRPIPSLLVYLLQIGNGLRGAIYSILFLSIYHNIRTNCCLNYCIANEYSITKEDDLICDSALLEEDEVQNTLVRKSFF